MNELMETKSPYAPSYVLSFYHVTKAFDIRTLPQLRCSPRRSIPALWPGTCETSISSEGTSFMPRMSQSVPLTIRIHISQRAFPRLIDHTALLAQDLLVITPTTEVASDDFIQSHYQSCLSPSTPSR